MGLEERRKIKELRDTVVPEREKELVEISGVPIKYEIDWDSFDLDALNFMDNISCFRIAMAMRVICTDELGKEAVADGLKLIKLQNAKAKEDMKLNFTAGVLELHNAHGLRTSGMFSDNEIRETLTKGL